MPNGQFGSFPHPHFFVHMDFEWFENLKLKYFHNHQPSVTHTASEEEVEETLQDDETTSTSSSLPYLMDSTMIICLHGSPQDLKHWFKFHLYLLFHIIMLISFLCRLLSQIFSYFEICLSRSTPLFKLVLPFLPVLPTILTGPANSIPCLLWQNGGVLLMVSPLMQVKLMLLLIPLGLTTTNKLRQWSLSSFTQIFSIIKRRHM